MHFGSRGVFGLAFIAAAAVSSAAINYSDVVATVSYDGGPSQNLTFIEDGNSITFNPPPTMIVSNGGPSSAVVSISYDVSSSKGLNGVDLIFDGTTKGTGTIDYSELIKNGATTLASTSGTVDGTNGPFLKEDDLKFSGGAQTSYSVTKTFDLSIGNVAAPGIFQGNGSSASIGLIEQNAVPEPVTLGAVGVGLFGLLARKRRK